jgi:hypothetical protein
MEVLEAGRTVAAVRLVDVTIEVAEWAWRGTLRASLYR